jgi:hypothetical protein
MTTKISRGLWLSAAASIVFAMGCGGGGETPDSGSGCANDAACGTGRVCHPVLKACVTSCTGASDCPAAEKTCARFDGTAATAATPGFCQCSTDALCGMSTMGNVCSTATKQCTAKCTSSASCPTGFTCNATSGQCIGTTMNTDAGTDGGMMNTDAGVACNSANGQPDTCGYGNVCPTNNVCEAAPVGTCGNVSTHPAWAAGTGTGPVIYNVVDEATDVAADCTQDNPFTVTVFAYMPAGQTFPAMKSNLPGFYYYPTSGNRVDVPLNLLRQSNYTLYQNGQVMSAKFTLCSSATQSIVGGFGFTNGNAVCSTLTR